MARAIVRIGWDLRHHNDRLHLIANQSRFVILPQHHQRNLASRVLSLCRRRIQADWVARFGYPLPRNARALLCRPLLNTRYHSGVVRMKLSAEQMQSLPLVFSDRSPIHVGLKAGATRW